jgi:hypothetical protein
LRKKRDCIRNTRFAVMQVLLNVYDLTPFNFYSAWTGLGAFHSGIEVNGAEYSFGSAVDGGSAVYSIPPRSETGMALRETLLLGTLNCSQRELQRAIDEVSAEFESSDYDILRRNCNDFSNALCTRLLGKGIPRYINRVAKVGACFSCLLPSSLKGRQTEDSRQLLAPQTDYILASSSQELSYTSKSKRELLAEAALARVSGEAI